MVSLPDGPIRGGVNITPQGFVDRYLNRVNGHAFMTKASHFVIIDQHIKPGQGRAPTG